MKVINEGSAQSFRLSARGDDGSAFTPTTVEWRLDCLTNDQEIIDWTTESPAPAVNVTTTGANNAIIDDSHAYEDKCITARFDHGLSTALVQEHKYRVINLSGIE